MKLAQALTAALALALSAPAFAARIVGNGGVGVVCNLQDGSRRYELLDYYQARRAWGMQPSLGGNLDYLAKARLVLDRVAAVDPARGALYQTWLAAFEDETLVYRDGQHFGVINDYGDPLLQNGCSVVQIAVQRPPENPEDRRYLIDGSLWDLLDEDHKAGLVLHEIIYRDALARGHADSVAAHYFTALYSSSKFAGGFDANELAKRLRLYDMDAFVYLSNFADTSHPEHRKFLYFADGPKTFEDARAFCRTLGSDAGLPNAADFTSWGGSGFAGWKASAIGAQLLAAGSTELWLDSGKTYTFRVNPSGEHDPAGATAGVVCWTSGRN